MLAVTVAPEAWSWAVRAAVSGPGWTTGTEPMNGLQKKAMHVRGSTCMGTSMHDDMIPVKALSEATDGPHCPIGGGNSIVYLPGL